VPGLSGYTLDGFASAQDHHTLHNNSSNNENFNHTRPRQLQVVDNLAYKLPKQRDVVWDLAQLSAALQAGVLEQAAALASVSG
jgi:hypothetical protein